MIRAICTIVLLTVLLLSAVDADLPQELDPFLEVLFDVKECDSFLSGDFTSVATVNCPPYKCDFPRQLCMRPNSKYQEASANECRPVPTECLTVANGGTPIVSSTLPISIPPPTISMTGDKSRKEIGGISGFGAGKTVSPMPVQLKDVCEMGPPDGRFCGFKVMYTYNKETLQCDEFWFPGCTTSETNANLFGDLQSCRKLADMCKAKSTPKQVLFPTSPAPPTTMWTPFPFLPPSTSFPPPPGPSVARGKYGGRVKPRRIGGVDGMGGTAGVGGGEGNMGGGVAGIGEGAGKMGGAVGGMGGGMGPFGTFPGLGSALGGPSPMVTPSAGGEEEDLGLLGLIQQSLKNAQAIKQGGPQGKQAAAAAAGQLLQQFTGFDLGNIGGNFGNIFGG